MSGIREAFLQIFAPLHVLSDEELQKELARALKRYREHSPLHNGDISNLKRLRKELEKFERERKRRKIILG
jgi:ferric-dicitrate binding protein FerR (iron transport regulator)